MFMSITIRQATILNSRIIALSLGIAIGEDSTKEYCSNKKALL